MKKFNTILIFGLLLNACSPSTRITGSWVDPAARNVSSIGKTVFIASLTRNLEARTKLENALAEQATQMGITPIKSSDRFSPEFYQKVPTEQQILSQIRNSGADAILTVSLIDENSETRYVPGTRTYSPFNTFGWYRGFYSYWNYWGPTFYDPGYYVTDKTYFLETNLYDVEGRKLIWSAQSETMNPGSIDNFVRTYPKILMARLVEDGLLPR